MPRVRNKSVPNQIQGNHINIQRNQSSGAVLVNQNSVWNTTSTAFASTMTDVVTPGYFKSRRQGLHLPVNVCSKSGVKSYACDSDIWTFKVTKNSNGIVAHESSCSGLFLSTLSANAGGVFPNYTQQKAWQGVSTNPAAPSDSNLLIQALADANTNAWDFLTFVAEFNKTVGMISRFKENVLNRSDRIVSQMSKRSKNPYRTANAVFTAFSESWLEYRYGWRTLSYDLQDISTALQRLQGLKSRPNRGTSYVANTATFSQNGVAGLYNNVGNIPSMNATLVHSNAVFSQVRTRSARGSVMLEGVANGLAFTDPLTTAWEIVPFSFIVDWFTNIGDLIKAYSPFVSGNVLHGCLSHVDQLVTTSSFSPSNFTMVNNYPIVNGYTHQITGGAVNRVVTTETYDRAPGSPSFSLQLKLNVDPAKLVDLSTLFQLANSKRINGLLKLIRA